MRSSFAAPMALKGWPEAQKRRRSYHDQTGVAKNARRGLCSRSFAKPVGGLVNKGEFGAIRVEAHRKNPPQTQIPPDCSFNRPRTVNQCPHVRRGGGMGKPVQAEIAQLDFINESDVLYAN